MFKINNLCTNLVNFTDLALPPRYQRHQYLKYEGLHYTDADIVDFEPRYARIYRRDVHRVQVFNFGGLPDLMAEGLSGRMLIEHRDAQGQSVFTSRAWRQLFDIRGPVVHKLILDFFSTFRFGETVLDLDTVRALQFRLGGARHHLSWRQFILALRFHTAEEMETVRFGAYRAESARQIPDKGDLRDYWIGISSARYFLGTSPSYIFIRDPILRFCHRLVACSIAGRSQAPKKVTVTDLFYLRGMDVGSVNVSYLLARYLRLFASGRKQGATISVVPGPERQPDAAAGAIRAAEDAPAVDEGDHAIPAPVQAPQLPPAVSTMPQRMVRLEEDVQEIRGALAEQREVIDVMARDFSRFTV
nr:hypothetical protein [Tanacetum cinerariifolium]